MNDEAQRQQHSNYRFTACILTVDWQRETRKSVRPCCERKRAVDDNRCAKRDGSAEPNAPVERASQRRQLHSQRLTQTRLKPTNVSMGVMMPSPSRSKNCTCCTMCQCQLAASILPLLGTNQAHLLDDGIVAATARANVRMLLAHSGVQASNARRGKDIVHVCRLALLAHGGVGEAVREAGCALAARASISALRKAERAQETHGTETGGSLNAAALGRRHVSARAVAFTSCFIQRCSCSLCHPVFAHLRRYSLIASSSTSHVH